MARSNGRAVAVAALGAIAYLLVSQIAAFVAPSHASSRQLRSRVALSATQADVDAAKKTMDLQKWSANHLASEGSPHAAAAATRAQQAEVAYLALKAQLDGQPPVAAAPVAARSAVPVAAAPVAAASAVSKADLAAAKQSAQLLSWAANKLASEGSPQAASMKVKADQAVAAFEAMKQAQASGGHAPAAAAPVPVPVAVTPAAPPAGGASKEAVAAAKKEMDLAEWAAKSLASSGSPAAAAMQAKAVASRQTYESLVAAR